MAIQPITFLTAGNAIAVNGSATITVTGNVDCSRIFEGSAVSLAGSGVVEGISGTTPDPVTFESTITLRYPWPDANISGRVTVFNTPEGLAESIRRVREIVANTSAIENIGTTGLLNKTGPSTYETVAITTQGRALIDDDTAADQRSTLGLGDAATKTVTTSATDTTVGRLLKVGDAGLLLDGSTNAPLIGNFDTNSISGLFRTAGGETGTPFTSAIASVINLSRTGDDAYNQLYIRGDANNPSEGQMYFRGVDSVGTSNWFELWHSGNLNVDDFGVVNGRLLGLVGVSVTGSIIRFEKPINRFATPSGISVTGVFNVLDNETGLNVLTSVVPTMSPVTTERDLYLDFAASGLPIGKTYRAVASGAATITVNT